MTRDMWAAVLGQGSIKEGENEDEVLPLLTAFREQIRSVREATKNRPDFERLNAPIIRAALSTAGAGRLDQPWTQMRDQLLKPETVSSWGLLAQSLDDTDDVVEKPALQALIAAINDLEAAAQSEKTPAALRKFVMDHVGALRRAVQMVPISGPGVLRTEVAAAFGDWVSDYNDVQEACREAPQESKNLLLKLRNVWTLSAKIYGNVDLLHKMLILGHESYDKGLPVIRFLLGGPDLTGGGGPGPGGGLL